MRASSLGSAAVVLLAFFLGGCSSNTISVVIESSSETNARAPFYVVFRSVEQATYLTDTYDPIAAKVFANPPDPTVIRSEVIYPGFRLKLKVPKHDTTSLAIYFLFTNPGGRWKTSREQPLSSSVDIELEKNQIKSEG